MATLKSSVTVTVSHDDSSYTISAEHLTLDAPFFLDQRRHPGTAFSSQIPAADADAAESPAAVLEVFVSRFDTIDHVGKMKPLLLAWSTVVLLHHGVSQADINARMARHIPHPDRHRILVHAVGHLLGDEPAILLEYVQKPFFPVSALSALPASVYKDGAEVCRLVRQAHALGKLTIAAFKQLYNETVADSLSAEEQEEDGEDVESEEAAEDDGDHDASKSELSKRKSKRRGSRSRLL